MLSNNVAKNTGAVVGFTALVGVGIAISAGLSAAGVGLCI